MATVLITGCSTGFGKLAALTFAREGHTVFASMRNLDKAGALREAAEADGLKIAVVQLDVDDAASIERAVSEVVSEAGGIDILVNNAGFEVRGPIEEATDAEARRQFETNVFGLLAVTRAVLPGMRTRGSGVLVNLSSIAGLVAAPFAGLYAASKHAVEALSESLHYEVAPFGIRVALVEPGGFATEFSANVTEADAFTTESPYRDYADRFAAALEKLTRPDGQAADPQIVADAIVRVATDASAPLRTILGDDAEMIMTVRNSTDFEGFEKTMREALDWWD
jgi:NAD(P)-dependent dehydrogenase (short-subunit alcohol dehydrogenase family)